MPCSMPLPLPQTASRAADAAAGSFAVRCQRVFVGDAKLAELSHEAKLITCGRGVLADRHDVEYPACCSG